MALDHNTSVPKWPFQPLPSPTLLPPIIIFFMSFSFLFGHYLHLFKQQLEMFVTDIQENYSNYKDSNVVIIFPIASLKERKSAPSNACHTLILCSCQVFLIIQCKARRSRLQHTACFLTYTSSIALLVSLHPPACSVPAFTCPCKQLGFASTHSCVRGQKQGCAARACYFQGCLCLIV